MFLHRNQLLSLFICVLLIFNLNDYLLDINKVIYLGTKRM